MRCPISDELEQWLFETFAWLLREFGGFQKFKGTELVTPTPECFPVDDVEPENLADAIFLIVKDYAGLSTWPCTLEMVESEEGLQDALRGVAHQLQRDAAAGSFHMSRTGNVVIRYDEHQLRRPNNLVATFAHELGHYLLSTAKTDPPGTDDAEEPATDMAAVFMGFGIFSANAAFSYEQFSDGLMQGWSTAREGYLHESALAYALAVFAELRNLPDKDIKRHLDTNPKGYFKKARKFILKHRAAELEGFRNT